MGSYFCGRLQNLLCIVWAASCPTHFSLMIMLNIYISFKYPNRVQVPPVLFAGICYYSINLRPGPYFAFQFVQLLVATNVRAAPFFTISYD